VVVKVDCIDNENLKRFGALITLVTIVADYYVGICHIDVEEELCVEEIHPGSDRTNRPVPQNQAPRHNSDFF
jgi:hypothetical protein